MPTNSTQAPWESGLRGARAHLGAGLVLQVAAVVLVVAYYSFAPAHEALSAVVVLRARTGLAFPILSTALFGGLLPWLFLRWEAARDAQKRTYSAGQGAALTLFWAFKGIEVAAFYWLQAALFGSGHTVGVVVLKVVFDQFVYCPVWAVPETVAVYHWVDSRFDGAAWWADLRAPRWYFRKVLPILISNVAVWVPAVAIIYVMPTPLQLPLQNLVLCFFTLIVAHQTRSAAVAVG